MTRPIYETQTDRNNERRLAAKIEKHYNCMLTKMPMKLSLDFMAMRDGKAVAFIEARQRKIAMNTYPTYMLSLYKAMQARLLTMTTGLPCFLAVQWTDKAGMVRLPPSVEDFYVEVGGTNRRDDPQDIEPMVHFDIAKFKEL
jgi:hypothetical protein